MRVVLIGIICGTVFGGVFAGETAFDPLKMYGGKTALQWLPLLKSKDVSVRRDAGIALRHTGFPLSAALDVLKAEADPESGPFIRYVFPAHGAEGVLVLKAALSHDDMGIRQSAVSELAACGGAKLDVIDSLLLAAGNSDADTRRIALQSLGYLELGKPTVERKALTDGLKDPDLGTRLAAAVSLMMRTGNAEASVPVFAEALKNRTRVMSTLHELTTHDLGPSAQGLVDPLMDFIAAQPTENYEFEQSYAVHALGNIGPAARDALPLLLRLRETVSSEELKAMKEAKLSQTALRRNGWNHTVSHTALVSIGKIRQDLPDTRDLTLRVFNAVQKKDAATFAAIASKEFLKTAVVDKMSDPNVTDVLFSASEGTCDEVYSKLRVAYNRSENGEPAYIHELNMSFVREDGELKLAGYFYAGW